MAHDQPDIQKPDYADQDFATTRVLREAIAQLRDEMHTDMRYLMYQEVGTLKPELTALKGTVQRLEQSFHQLDERLPSAELMVEVKSMLAAHKETRAHLKRGGFWVVFAVIGAVLAEPVKTTIRAVGAKHGWW